MPEFDVFAGLIRLYGPQEDVQPMMQSYAETYHGRLPRELLRFWVDHGVGSWKNGRFWLCDPALLRPVIDEIFAGDPEFHPDDLPAFAYEAFGSKLYLWHPQKKVVYVNMMDGQVLTLPEDALTSKQTGKYYSDGFTMGAQVSGLLYEDEAWSDQDGEKLFEPALKRLGRLAPGEIYGFVPALQLGGTNLLPFVHKLPIVEHLLFLCSLNEYRLMQHIDIPGTFGRIDMVRPIGPQP
jgi:hypothetical protein